MHVRKVRKPRPPLDPSTLDELAFAYVAKFATTRAKLKAYLERKVRERGWEGEGTPDLGQVADRFAASGYVDDAVYALAKSRSLTGRGYGARRVDQSLRAAGVDELDSEPARELARSEAPAAALRFAQRRRIGPFAAVQPDPKGRERALAAMLRAGHSFALARAIVGSAPGKFLTEADLEEFGPSSD